MDTNGVLYKTKYGVKFRTWENYEKFRRTYVGVDTLIKMGKLGQDWLEAKKQNPTTLDYLLYNTPTEFLDSKE